jgi:hypothetical protein
MATATMVQDRQEVSEAEAEQEEDDFMNPKYWTKPVHVPIFTPKSPQPWFPINRDGETSLRKRYPQVK